MKPLAAKSGVLAGITLAVWLTSASALAQPSTDSPGKGPHGPVPVTVVVTPNARGDVAVSIYAAALPGHPDVAAMVRGALRCDWRTNYSGTKHVLGVCRRLLKSDVTFVNDWLMLAPLASALHQAGAGTVEFALDSSGQPLAQAGLQWDRGPAPSSRSHARSRGSSHYHFTSSSPAELPPPFAVQIGSPWKPTRLAAPFLLVFFGPALLAFWLRRRTTRKGTLRSGVVWLNWILLGSWLYWISAVNVTDLPGFSASLRIDSAFSMLFIGAALFSLPLLVAIGSCVLALAPPAHGAGSPSGETVQLLKRSLAREGAFLIPLALVLSGAGMMDLDWRVSMFSWMAAIARLAGVQIRNVYVLGSRLAREANAFALGGGDIILTRSLLDNLTTREVDTVMAHELGHLRGKHVGIRPRSSRTFRRSVYRACESSGS